MTPGDRMWVVGCPLRHITLPMKMKLITCRRTHHYDGTVTFFQHRKSVRSCGHVRVEVYLNRPVKSCDVVGRSVPHPAGKHSVVQDQNVHSPQRLFGILPRNN